MYIFIWESILWEFNLNEHVIGIGKFARQNEDGIIVRAATMI